MTDSGKAEDRKAQAGYQEDLCDFYILDEMIPFHPVIRHVRINPDSKYDFPEKGKNLLSFQEAKQRLVMLCWTNAEMWKENLKKAQSLTEEEVKGGK